jgi:hypothetical protein
VHPLQGGLDAWMALNFPVVSLTLPPTRAGESAAVT